MKHFLFIVVLLLPVLIHAQEKTYYDESWQPVRKGKAKYYRLVDREGELYRITDFYSNGKLYRTGYRNEIETHNYKGRIGRYEWFDIYGNKLREGEFVNGIRTGVWREFYNNGTPRSEAIWSNGRVASSTEYDSVTRQVTKQTEDNGNIEKVWWYAKDSLRTETAYDSSEKIRKTYTSIAFYKNGQVKRKLVQERGKKRVDECFSPNGAPETCNTSGDRLMVDEMPAATFKLGDFLRSTLRYPSKAVEKHLTGKVIVRFMVDEDGTISDVILAKGIDPLLDNEAIRVINEMPPWYPAILSGREIRMPYALPITFKLD